MTAASAACSDLPEPSPGPSGLRVRCPLLQHERDRKELHAHEPAG
ncbi:hypothetical protein ACFPRL_27995 [Pseudoclavibacter helvolus]